MSGISRSNYVVIGSPIQNNNNNRNNQPAIYSAPSNIPAYVWNPCVTTIAPQQSISFKSYVTLLKGDKQKTCKELSCLKINSLSLKQCQETVSKIKSLVPSFQSWASIPDYNGMHLAMSARRDLIGLHNLIASVEVRRKAVQAHYDTLDCSLRGYFNASLTAMVDEMIRKVTPVNKIEDEVLKVLPNSLTHSPSMDAVQGEEMGKVKAIIKGLIDHRRACVAAQNPR